MGATSPPAPGIPQIEPGSAICRRTENAALHERMAFPKQMVLNGARYRAPVLESERTDHADRTDRTKRAERHARGAGTISEVASGGE